MYTGLRTRTAKCAGAAINTSCLTVWISENLQTGAITTDALGDKSGMLRLSVFARIVVVQIH